jgi:hypothetical protein
MIGQAQAQGRGQEPGQREGQLLPWGSAVNNADTIPGNPGSNFNSYNQPSINANGLIVFRARSSGQGGAEPISGIFLRNTNGPGLIVPFLKRGDAVPQPNNTLYNGAPAAFEEFPSTPRIDHVFDLIATRGQSARCGSGGRPGHAELSAVFGARDGARYTLRPVSR